MKIYISGKITRQVNYRHLFKKAEEDLLLNEHEVVNPVTIGDELTINPDWPETKQWAGYMKADIHAMLECDAVYMLANWEDSTGAVMEREIAIKCGMIILGEK